MANRRPSPPSSLQVNGKAEYAEQRTENTSGSLPVSAIIDDPNSGQYVRLVVRWSSDKQFATYTQAVSSWGGQNRRRSVTLRSLKGNTLYYGRAYTQDRSGLMSTSYNSFTFWTNRTPLGPELVSPPDNISPGAVDSILFDWVHNDPDVTENPVPTGWRLEYRVAGTPLVPAAAWVGIQGLTSATSYTVPGNTFKAGTIYEWRVRTRDRRYQWGAYSEIRSFQVVGSTRPPTLTAPVGERVINVEIPQTFTWRFSDPLASAVQGAATIRWRVVGTTPWFSALVVGQDGSYVMPPNTIASGRRYEWQVQTIRDTGLNPASDWSSSAYFWTILTPGSKATDPLPVGAEMRGVLGVGDTQVFVALRGGEVLRGEITKMQKVVWGRERDALSTCTITITASDDRQAQLLSEIHTWSHEMVVVRDGDRVWEGPVTLIQQQRSKVVIQAHDVMVYPYRRIMRQGYNDSYRVVKGIQRGLYTHVQRATAILVNALGYDDPNVLPFLTALASGQDAHQSRVVPDYAKSAFDEVDSLASDAGLDYTTAVRRIYLWDTHNKIGILPTLSSEHFSEELIISEYGLQGANYYAATDGQGLWGAAYPPGLDASNFNERTGPVEMLVTGYGETAAQEATSEALTEVARLAQIEALSGQARRGIGSRYPFPRSLRVPDNSSLMPSSNVPIEQLIPGVWVPIEVDDVITPMRQVQKLDSMTVTVAVEEGQQLETVGVKMSPAPTAADDPDAAGGDGDEEGAPL